MTKILAFLLSLYLLPGNYSSFAQTPSKASNFLFPPPAQEFSINFYNYEGQLKLTVPVQQVRYVEWNKMVEFYFYDDLINHWQSINLAGGYAQVVFKGKVIGELKAHSPYNSDLPKKGKHFFVGLNGEIGGDSPIIVTLPSPVQDEVYAYLKGKNKIRE